MTNTNTDMIMPILDPSKTIQARKEALTKKERMFCEYYAISNNASESARKAGYCDGSVVQKKLMKNHAILQLLELLRKQMVQQYILQTEYCVMQYKQCINAAKEAGDYNGCANIIQKLSKLKQPIQGSSITGQVTIKVV